MTDWNQFKGDRRHGGVRRELEGPHRVEEGWSVDLTGAVGSPVLDRDTVFVGTDRGNLYALERETGRRRWVVETMTATDTAPVVTYDAVFFGTADGTIHAVDPASGEVQWETEIEPNPTSLAFADEQLYAGHEGGVSAIAAETGEEIWTHETDEPVAGCPAVADEREWSGARVFVGTDGEAASALEAETGEEVWTVPTDGAVTDGPTVVGDRAYVGDAGGMLLALNGETGQSWFTYKIQDEFTSSATVLADDDTTFVGASDGYLHVTDTQFGRRRVRGWLFSKKGIALDGEVRASPVVIGDVVCVGDSTGSLYGIDATDYDHLWHFGLGGAITSTPAVGEQQLFVGSDDGVLHCLTWTLGEPRP
ncbi:PQQ-binding-like beta-propeller repeat protein [Natrialbaceae archaeon A-arb3/5]